MVARWAINGSSGQLLNVLHPSSLPAIAVVSRDAAVSPSLLARHYSTPGDMAKAVLGHLGLQSSHNAAAIGKF